MQEYVQSLLLTVAVASLASFLLPEKNERLSRALQLGISLFVLAVVCRPIGAIGELGDLLPPLDFDESVLTPDTSGETWREMESAVGEGIVKDLCARYDLSEDDVRASVTLLLADKELTVSSLLLTFSGKARLADITRIRAYAQKTYTVNCEVRLDGG